MSHSPEKTEYRHDEWCSSVMEGEGNGCDCYVRLLRQKDREISELNTRIQRLEDRLETTRIGEPRL